MILNHKIRESISWADQCTEVRFASPFRWIYYCHSSKSTGKETGKTHLCAVVSKVILLEFVLQIRSEGANVGCWKKNLQSIQHQKEYFFRTLVKDQQKLYAFTVVAFLYLKVLHQYGMSHKKVNKTIFFL